VPERPSRPFVFHEGIGTVQAGIYLFVGLLLITAAAFTIAGTVVDVVEGSRSRPIGDTGVFVLDRVLLLFMLAELLYTLRLVDAGGRILVEPFLLIGLIAVLRRILVIAAEIEGDKPRDISDFVLEIAAFGGLAFLLTASIFLLRRSAAARPGAD
jgi:uncharacterized membrane protein (DUF373 family)